MVADSSDAYSQNAENKYITRYLNSLYINLFVCLGVWHHRLANGAHRLKPRHGCLLLVLEAVPSLLIQNVYECNIQIVFDEECIYLNVGQIFILKYIHPCLGHTPKSHAQV